MPNITIREIRKAIAELPDDAIISIDVDEGPDEYTVELRSIDFGVPERWQNVANASELHNGMWLHMAIIPMNDDEDDEECETVRPTDF